MLVPKSLWFLSWSQNSLWGTGVFVHVNLKFLWYFAAHQSVSGLHLRYIVLASRRRPLQQQRFLRSGAIGGRWRHGTSRAHWPVQAPENGPGQPLLSAELSSYGQIILAGGSERDSPRNRSESCARAWGENSVMHILFSVDRKIFSVHLWSCDWNNVYYEMKYIIIEVIFLIECFYFPSYPSYPSSGRPKIRVQGAENVKCSFRWSLPSWDINCVKKRIITVYGLKFYSNSFLYPSITGRIKIFMQIYIH